jgi:protein regulator of cytokinesis 1
VVAIKGYASHFESSFVKVALPPTEPNSNIPPTFNLSSSYCSNLDAEFSRVYDEYTKRISSVQAIGEDIINLWAELGTPQAQTDLDIVKYYRDKPEQLGLRQDDIARLSSRRERLMEEKRTRERRLKELKMTVEHLWERLDVDNGERKGFMMRNRGCGLRVINDYEDELARLNELKRQHMHVFVEDARCRLQELWDSLYFSEEEMLEFTPAFSGTYSSLRESLS